MKIKTGNYLKNAGKKSVIKIFQNVAYQILYGNYINDEFKTEDDVINYSHLCKEYKGNVDSLLIFDILYYRIISTECNYIVQFLNSGLEIVCGVETIPEEKGFEN